MDLLLSLSARLLLLRYYHRFVGDRLPGFAGCTIVLLHRFLSETKTVSPVARHIVATVLPLPLYKYPNFFSPSPVHPTPTSSQIEQGYRPQKGTIVLSYRGIDSETKHESGSPCSDRLSNSRRTHPAETFGSLRRSS
jgi:hypothetical protein